MGARCGLRVDGGWWPVQQRSCCMQQPVVAPVWPPAQLLPARRPPSQLHLQGVPPKRRPGLAGRCMCTRAAAPSKATVVRGAPGRPRPSSSSSTLPHSAAICCRLMSTMACVLDSLTRQRGGIQQRQSHGGVQEANAQEASTSDRECRTRAKACCTLAVEAAATAAVAAATC